MASGGPSGSTDTSAPVAARGNRPASRNTARTAPSPSSTRCRSPPATNHVVSPGPARSTPSPAPTGGRAAASPITVVPVSAPFASTASHTAQLARIVASGVTATAPGTAAAGVRGAVASDSSGTTVAVAVPGSPPAEPPERSAASTSRAAGRSATGTSRSGSCATAYIAPDGAPMTTASCRQSGLGTSTAHTAAPHRPSSPSTTPASAARRCDRICSCSGTGSPRTNAASIRRRPKR